MIRFSEEAWQRTASLREAIHTLPFNIELAAGTLARDRFQHYIVQDALYLGQFSRALAIAAASSLPGTERTWPLRRRWMLLPTKALLFA